MNKEDKKKYYNKNKKDISEKNKTKYKENIKNKNKIVMFKNIWKILNYVLNALDHYYTNAESISFVQKIALEFITIKVEL